MCQIVAIVGEAFALKTLVIITSGMLAAAEGVRFGQKQTCAVQNAMSALPRIATAEADVSPQPLVRPNRSFSTAEAVRFLGVGF
jgi:hypothetical protein